MDEEIKTNEEQIDETVKEVVEEVKEIVEERDLTAERDARCEPVAAEIMKMFSKFDLPATKLKHEEMYEKFAPAVNEINALMKEKGLSISDVNYTWSIARTIFDSLSNLSNLTVQNAFEEAEKKLFSVDNMGNVTLLEIDNVLK